MKYAPFAAQILSIVIFAWYGMGCFFSARMIHEFERYQVPQLRRLTGVLQVAGAVGLIAGHWFRPFLVFSAGGLALMMLIAVVTRFRIHDPLYLAVPAFSLVLLNAYLVIAAFLPR